jgi:hypothetical protein
MFTGSYDPDDVVFLLKPAAIAPTPVAEKERLIQSGARHYSEMLSAEGPPSAAYLRAFHEGLALTRERFAKDLVILARLIAEARTGPITLVSLARAGTPVGAILGRLLRQMLRRRAVHYSISIIRDRGIDETALRFILERHPPTSVVFIDGWTGKGVIAEELRKSIENFNEKHHVALDAGLYTVADLSGTAAVAATAEDYLIPCSILGCTVNGLVSRSVLNGAVVGPGDFHACVFYEQHRADDLSRWFLDTVTDEALRQASRQAATLPTAAGVTPAQRQELRAASAAFLQAARERFMIRDVNHVKPGIGEATRVLLRRLPDLLLVRDPDLPDVAHLRQLAAEKGVPVAADPALPYLAAALIKEIDG